MLISTLPIQPAKFGHGDPVVNLKKDLGGNDREPRELFGNFELFQKGVAMSDAVHPYLSYFISYKGEEKIPAEGERKHIHRLVLRWFASGVAEDSKPSYRRGLCQWAKKPASKVLF